MTSHSESSIPGRWAFAWIVPVIVAIWWPVGSYWQSDDYLAVHYSSEFGRALSDFIGPQYGISSLVLFYRPLITISFALDQWFGGDAASFVSHVSNVLAHGCSAAILACVASRFVPRDQAAAAGLIWGLSPAHASSVYWAVGRVDSHTTVWMVLCALYLVQWCRGERRSRWAAVFCGALALCSKELAMVTPGIALVLCFAASPGQRVRQALRGSWPFFALLAANLVWRRWRLGIFLGGYESEIQVVDSLRGLGVRTAELANPLLHAGGVVAGPVVWLGFVPLLVALIAVIWSRRTALLAAALALYVGCAVSTIQTWGDVANPMNLRNFYVPMMPLAVVFAAWGWRSAVPFLLVAAVPFLDLRSDYIESWRRCSGVHASLLEAARPGLNFVHGLRRTNLERTALEFHIGVDRILRPPFAASADRAAYALRPMSQKPEAFRLPYGPRRALPFGSTLSTGSNDSAALVEVPSGVEAMETRWKGERVLTVAVLDRMVANFLLPAGQPPQGQDPVVVLPGVRTTRRFRVTVFTAGGYLTTFVPDSGKADSPDGEVAIGAILYGGLWRPGAGGDDTEPQRVGSLLQHATALDLSHRFPVLIEVDTRPGFSGNPADFQPSRANFEPVWIDLPRLFADWWP